MGRTFRMLQNSKFFCTRCGKEGIPIIRKQGQERKAGHLKKLYCIYCQEEVNHAEIKDENYTYNDFLNDYNSGYFHDNKLDILEK